LAEVSILHRQQDFSVVSFSTIGRLMPAFLERALSKRLLQA
jgi:hypothetical protein